MLLFQDYRHETRWTAFRVRVAPRGASGAAADGTISLSRDRWKRAAVGSGISRGGARMHHRANDQPAGQESGCRLPCSSENALASSGTPMK